MAISQLAMFKPEERKSEFYERHHEGRKYYNFSADGKGVPLQGIDWASQRACTMPQESLTELAAVYDFEVRDDDVFVVTFPKCGTTWMQETTWLLMHDLNFEEAKATHLSKRSIFIDMGCLYANVPAVAAANQLPSPRNLKSHFPCQLLPRQLWTKDAKIVYVARNPKDVVVSFYHFHRGLGTWHGTIDEFVDELIADDIMFCPYWEHMVDFWNMRDNPKIYFTTYEQMKRDLRTVLVELNAFLGKPKLSEEALDRLVEHLSFKNMRANGSANPTQLMKSLQGILNVREDFQFMRRGEVGSFKDELSAESLQKLDKWIAEKSAALNVDLKEIFGEF